jgi:Protein of unknown function (DUF2793)
MSQTPRFSLPLIAAGQAQKHVTHNEALMALDFLVQLSVSGAPANTPPANPVEGQCVIVGSSPTGIFAGKAQAIAAYQDGQWRFFTPVIGWLATRMPEGSAMVFDGASWRAISVSSAETLGVSTSASNENRLAVAANASLFTHAGTGHQLKINKAATNDTASVLFQEAYSGRAEIGLNGNSNLSIKVSGDGTLWKTALSIHPGSGWLGCGIASPSAPLDVGNADNGYVMALRGGPQVLSYQVYGTTSYFWNYGGSMIMGTNAAFDLRFGTNSSERMRIKATGEIGIGTVSPTTALDVAGPVRVGQYAKTALPSASTSGAGAIIYVSNDVGGPVLAFSDGTDWRRVTDRLIIS